MYEHWKRLWNSGVSVDVSWERDGNKGGFDFSIGTVEVIAIIAAVELGGAPRRYEQRPLRWRVFHMLQYRGCRHRCLR